MSEYLSACGTFQMDPYKKAYFPQREAFATLWSLPSINVAHFIKNSWICTSVTEMMVCAGLVLIIAGVKEGH